MTRRAGLALLALLASGAGCGQRSDETAQAPVPPAAPAPDSVAGRRVLVRERGAPGDSIQGHAVYRVEWPDSSLLPGSGPLADSVRAAIAFAVAEGQLDGAGRPLPADSLAGRFLAGHADLRRSFPEGPGEWNITRSITLETLPFGLSTLRIDDERYEGCAHGMTSVVWQSFDPATGRRLRLSDLATGAPMDSLRALGERAFRVAKGLPPGEDLKNHGWFWETGRFALPDNFGVTRAGLVFHWNPYDIAPYASGASSITLPWSAVRPHLRSDGPLAAGR
ncbi:MAG: RsiV family protein [Candidatus Eisenbacteria bacterium]